MSNSFPPSQLTDEAKLRLICLPYAGGGAAGFYRWRSAMPPMIDLVPLSLPGHDGRLKERPVTNLQQLVDSLVDELAERAIDRPFALLGHSMGAWLAFEIARTLRRRALREPLLLIVTASRPPSTATANRPWHQLPDDELLATIDKRYGGIPPAIRNHPEMLRLLIPALRADLQMIETYEYVEERPLDVDIFALGGTDDPAVSATQLGDWARYTTRECDVRLLPGGHFFLFQGSGAPSATVATQSADASPALQVIFSRLARCFTPDSSFPNESQ